MKSSNSIFKFLNSKTKDDNAFCSSANQIESRCIEQARLAERVTYIH